MGKRTAIIGCSIVFLVTFGTGVGLGIFFGLAGVTMGFLLGSIPAFMLAFLFFLATARNWNLP